jgi:hypothetical protein
VVFGTLVKVYFDVKPEWHYQLIRNSYEYQNNFYGGESFNIMPVSKGGQLSLVILFLGLFIFFCGTVMGSQGLHLASLTAVTGMIVFFIGGWFRTRFS